ncbi:hypothetical protein G6F65_015218 [Rhizopus arrhizus]|nr:hypothetical protein G6F65_015218 [Rhizopus arrhizus]
MRMSVVPPAKMLGALLHARGDQAFHALAGAAGNDRADIGAGHGAAADLQGLGLGHQVLHPAAGLTDQHQGGGGHATLAGGTEGGADHRIEGLFLVGVRQHHGVVLGAHHALHALAGQRGAVVHVGTDAGGTDERHGLDVRVVADRVDHFLAAVDDVQHALRNARFQRKLDQAHGNHWVLLGRLEDEGVTGGDRHREHPQREPRREVERGDAGAHAQRLHDRVGVHAIGHVVGQLAQLQVADGGRVLAHFQAAEHIAFGVGQGLALFGGEDVGQLAHVLADQLLVLQEDARAGADRGLAPGLEGFLGGGDGGVHFAGGGERHLGQHVLGGRIDHVLPVGGGRFNELAIDQHADTGRCNSHDDNPTGPSATTWPASAAPARTARLQPGRPGTGIGAVGQLPEPDRAQQAPADPGRAEEAGRGTGRRFRAVRRR